jgi:F-type H+-transporting ATPase subunit epsilon
MHLSITTPRGAVAETEVEEVTAPGLVGEFGVLPGHVPLMAALKPGVLVYRTGERATTLAVAEGFLQVAPVTTPGDAQGKTVDRVLVLVGDAVGAGAVDVAAAQKKLAEVEAELASWKREFDGSYQALLSRRDWALAQINAAARQNPS